MQVRHGSVIFGGYFLSGLRVEFWRLLADTLNLYSLNEVGRVTALCRAGDQLEVSNFEFFLSV